MYKFYNRNFVQPPGCTAKILLTMKITTLLLVTAILQVSASSFAQKITLSEKNASIKTVFNKIRSQCGYDFMVTKSALEAANPVTIEVKNGELKDVLEQIFKNQPLEYEITNRFVNIKIREKSFLTKVLDAVLAKNIGGKVVDQNGDPLQGATVAVVGYANSTTTSQSGTFILQNVDENATIRISYMGYVTRDIKAGDDFTTIKLMINDSKLDEVKVIAYGTTTERLSTGNASTIKAADIEKQPVNNILDAMIGRIAGLQISQTSGIPGAAPNVIIRGGSNINTQISTDPLYILDGVPVSATQALSNTGALDNRAFNLLTSLNTTDIESVTVLKDADATAIYGSRGANGVIIITTKKGRPGKMVTTIKASVGFQKVGHFIDLLNTDQYVAMRTEAFKNDGLTPNLTVGNTNYAPDLLLWDRNNVTNWQKEFIGKTAVSNDLSFNMSGGTDNTKYFISGANHQEGTVMPGDSKFTRNSFTASINNTSVNKKFTLNVTTSYSMSNLNLLPTDLINSIYMAPYAPMYNADGSINWNNYPLAYTLRKYALPTKNFAGNALMSYEFIPGLKLKATGGTNTTNVNMSLEQPKGSFDPASGALASLSKQTVENNNWIVEPQLEYNHLFQKHHINALIGATYQKTTSTSTQQNGTGFSDDGLISNIAAASTITTSYGYTPYAYSAFFGRLSYDFKQEFLANFTFRRDGSSRFGDGDKFGNFGAVGLGWIFTEEKWLKEHMSFLSFGKLRGSYGITGTDGIGEFQYLNVYSSSANGPGGASGLLPAGIANPILHWQSNKKSEIGLELGFLNDRILINAAYFRNRSGDQLLSTPISPQAGFFTYPANFPGVVQNQGTEFEVSTRNNTGKFTWNTSFNISVLDNKLISYPDFDKSNLIFRLALNQSLNVVKGTKFNGLNAAGVPTYLYGNGTTGTASPANIATSADRSVLGDKDPLYGGISNDFSYKGFTFGFFINFSRNRGTPAYYPNNIVGGSNKNWTTYVLNAWHQPGDEAHTDIPRYTKGFTAYDTNALFNTDHYVYQTWYVIRLSNAALSYNIPSQIISKLDMTRVQLFVNAQNLFVVDPNSKWEFDPQTGNTSLPPLRTIMFGINASF